MEASLPDELLRRCDAVQDSDAQGTSLTTADYARFFVVTVLVPAILVIVGVLL